MLSSFFLLLLSLAIVIKSADLAIKYSGRLAASLNLSKYVVGFLVVAVISVLPEAFISITAAAQGVPSFGLGTLFGSNVADLTLVFALVVFVSGRQLRVQSKIIKNHFWYLGVMMAPIIMGANGRFSREEGLILIFVGLTFYYLVIKENAFTNGVVEEKFNILNVALLLLSMGVLLFGSHLTVTYGVDLATGLNVRPILIGMFIVGLGTVLPELFFSIRAAKKHQDELALGDILGTVIVDAVVIVGILAVIRPFTFNPRIIYVTGFFMVTAAALLFYFMKSGRSLSRKESFLLIIFYALFVFAELLAAKI